MSLRAACLGCLECRAFGRLGNLLVGRVRHISSSESVRRYYNNFGTMLLPSKFDQDSLHGEVSLPLRKTGQFGRVNLHLLAHGKTQGYYLPYLSIPRIYARQINLRCERYLRGSIGVIWSAMDLDSVDAILVNAL